MDFETATFSADVLASTEMAVLVSYDGEEVWLPRSQIEDGEREFAEGAEEMFTINAWIAKQKGII